MLSKQQGVAGLDDLVKAGLGRRPLRAALARGHLLREGRWLVLDPSWAPVTPGDQWRHELYRRLCSCSPKQRAGVKVFRRSAAALWECDGVPPLVVELATSRGCPAGTGLYRVRHLPAGDCALVDGLPVTSVLRTLLDLGQVVNDAVVERALEWALRKRHVSVDEVRAAVGAIANQRGTRALRQLVSHREPGLPPTESDAETLFLQLARRTGLPEPQRQFSVPTVEGTFRLDFAWPARALAVEIDGAGTHASRDALRRDLRRQNRLMLSLTAGGWALLRFTWDDVNDERYAAQLSANLREAWVIGLNRTS